MNEKEKPYAIIYWQKGRFWGPYPYVYQDTEIPTEALFTFETIEKADEAANKFEQEHPEYECRVITIDSVHE